MTLPDGTTHTGEYQEGKMWRGVAADPSGAL
eukprot:SAG11_NODE_30524_length_300_cov_0.761194_1_plen_30_part_10